MQFITALFKAKMKRFSVRSLFFISIAIIQVSCSNTDNEVVPPPTNEEDFNKYWYDGQAEISRYELHQARYGEMRDGDAVMIFVTEPFSKKYQTKADEESDENITVLKLNFMKDFVTGIYPYSIMTSVFYPVSESKSAIKLSSSIQEWCGQTYTELNRNNHFDISMHSYFQGESTTHQVETNILLEDEIWTMIRVRSNDLPKGKQKMIPSFSYLGLAHKELKPYDCVCSIKSSGDTAIYTITYDEIERNLEIYFQSNFPHKILKWKETYPCVTCKEKKIMTSSGNMKETMKIEYWNKNSVADSISRTKLGFN